MSQSIDRSIHAPGRREAIITEAAALFDEAGYALTSMGDIAKRVGIAKPTLYHYFTSKDEILSMVHEEFIDILLRKHEQRRSAHLEAEIELREMMVDILELMESHRGHVRVFFEHHRELSAGTRATIREKRTRYEGAMRELVADLVESGRLRSIPTPLATYALFGMCNWAYQWYRPNGPYTPREVAETFWDLFMRGAISATGQSAAQ